MILVFGTICLDRVRRVPHFPQPGGYVEQTEELVLLGGEAANTASVLKAWGADVRLAGNWLGKGLDGERLRTLLDERGLIVENDHPSSRQSDSTPICDVFITPDGERTMIGIGFSAMDGLVDLSALPYSRGNWFTAEPNMSQTSRQAVRLAHEAGMKLYLMDFFRENERIPEGAICQYGSDWVGVHGDVSANLTWAREWSKRHRCTTILTDGAVGFVVSSTAGDARHVPALEIPSDALPPGMSAIPVDSTGAGDAFRAGMLYGLDLGWPFEDCLDFASAAGALSTLALGASQEVPSLELVLQLARLPALFPQPPSPSSGEGGWEVRHRPSSRA